MKDPEIDSFYRIHIKSQFNDFQQSYKCWTKNKHEIMNDVHIAETDCWKEQICILNDALMSQ